MLCCGWGLDALCGGGTTTWGCWTLPAACWSPPCPGWPAEAMFSLFSE